MARFLFGLVLVAALAAAAALVPIRGRTVLDRWQSAGSAGEFLRRAYDEARQARDPDRGHPRAGHAQQSGRPSSRARPASPAEHHSERDRAAIDRILTERAGR